VVRAGHVFRLEVSVGDDAGARSAASRLQERGPRGGYRWLGAWHRLRLNGGQPPDWETYSFAVTENRPGTYTFRAVLSTPYPSTYPVTVTVR
jgi:hypothetical protein